MSATKFKRERWALGTDYRYRCTDCGEIKKTSQFGKQKRARWGLSPACKLCINKKRMERKTPEVREKLRVKSRDLARKKADIARAADAKYDNWLWRQKQGLKVNLGKPGWSKESDCCLQCGTFFHPHHGKGLCHKCYARDYQGIKAHQFHRGGKWAYLYDHCIECGKTEREHAGKGICKGCLWRNHKKKKPANPYCASCGEAIPMTTYAAKRKYCSDKCGSRAYRLKRKQQQETIPIVVDQEHVVAVEKQSGQAVLQLAV